MCQLKKNINWFFDDSRMNLVQCLLKPEIGSIIVSYLSFDDILELSYTCRALRYIEHLGDSPPMPTKISISGCPVSIQSRFWLLWSDSLSDISDSAVCIALASRLPQIGVVPSNHLSHNISRLEPLPIHSSVTSDPPKDYLPSEQSSSSISKPLFPGSPLSSSSPERKNVDTPVAPNSPINAVSSASIEIDKDLGRTFPLHPLFSPEKIDIASSTLSEGTRERMSAKHMLSPEDPRIRINLAGSTSKTIQYDASQIDLSSKGTATGLKLLRSVLLGFCVARPNTGYCQGMNYISAVLLLGCGSADEHEGRDDGIKVRGHLPPLFHNKSDEFYHSSTLGHVPSSPASTRALTLLLHLNDTLKLHLLWSPGLQLLKPLTKIVLSLLSSREPILSVFMQENPGCLENTLAQWVIPLFSTAIPLQTMLQTMGIIFFEGWVGIYRVILLLLKLSAPAFLGDEDASSKLLRVWRAAIIATSGSASFVRLEGEGLSQTPISSTLSVSSASIDEKSGYPDDNQADSTSSAGDRRVNSMDQDRKVFVLGNGPAVRAYEQLMDICPSLVPIFMPSAFLGLLINYGRDLNASELLDAERNELFHQIKVKGHFLLQSERASEQATLLAIHSNNSGSAGTTSSVNGGISNINASGIFNKSVIQGPHPSGLSLRDRIRSGSFSNADFPPNPHNSLAPRPPVNTNSYLTTLPQSFLSTPRKVMESLQSTMSSLTQTFLSSGLAATLTTPIQFSETHSAIPSPVHARQNELHVDTSTRRSLSQSFDAEFLSSATPSPSAASSSHRKLTDGARTPMSRSVRSNSRSSSSYHVQDMPGFSNVFGNLNRIALDQAIIIPEDPGPLIIPPLLYSEPFLCRRSICERCVSTGLDVSRDYFQHLAKQYAPSFSDVNSSDLGTTSHTLGDHSMKETSLDADQALHTLNVPVHTLDAARKILNSVNTLLIALFHIFKSFPPVVVSSVPHRVNLIFSRVPHIENRVGGTMRLQARGFTSTPGTFSSAYKPKGNHAGSGTPSDRPPLIYPGHVSRSRTRSSSLSKKAVDDFHLEHFTFNDSLISQILGFTTDTAALTMAHHINNRRLPTDSIEIALAKDLFFAEQQETTVASISTSRAAQAKKLMDKLATTISSSSQALEDLEKRVSQLRAEKKKLLESTHSAVVKNPSDAQSTMALVNTARARVTQLDQELQPLEQLRMEKVREKKSAESQCKELSQKLLDYSSSLAAAGNATAVITEVAENVAIDAILALAELEIVWEWMEKIRKKVVENM